MPEGKAAKKSMSHTFHCRGIREKTYLFQLKGLDFISVSCYVNCHFKENPSTFLSIQHIYKHVFTVQFPKGNQNNMVAGDTQEVDDRGMMLCGFSKKQATKMEQNVNDEGVVNSSRYIQLSPLESLLWPSDGGEGSKVKFSSNSFPVVISREVVVLEHRAPSIVLNLILSVATHLLLSSFSR